MGGPWAKGWQKDCQEDWQQDWQQARASGGWLVLAGPGESPPPLPPPELLPVVIEPLLVTVTAPPLAP